MKNTLSNVKFSAVSRASMLQHGVVSSLKSLGLRPQEEWPSQSGYSIDESVHMNGEKVGV